jgi:hypothetical protein
MPNQTNNFYGPVGAAGISDSTVHIDMSQLLKKQELVVVARELTNLLDSIERSQSNQHISSPALTGEFELAISNYPELSEPKFIEASINSDPTLRQRILAASSAASLETVKVLFPPLAVAIEAVRAFQAPGSSSGH